MTERLFADLTPPQREAASHLGGPMLVVAGAGSGKTRVVTRRVAHLIGQGVAPWRLLTLTFTNKAAREMRERVEKLVGRAPSWMGTFHAICARLLRRDIGLLADGRDSRFSILDQGDQEGLVKNALKALATAGKENRPGAILSRIGRIKSDFILPGDFRPESWRDEVVAQVYREYERQLRSMNALDFDDLLILTARLLEASPEALARYRSWFPFILVDEYQDTNRAQYRLLKALAGPDANLHATGDPDQSIYSWRGADYRNIMDFQSDFPGARLVRLEENYRSGRFILEAANQLIRHNPDRLAKELRTSRPGGEKVRLARLPSDRLEAEWIGEQAAKLLAGGAPAGEIAVFYRTNAQSRTLEEAFVNRNIPYQLIGGVRFYDRREIKDLLAILRARVNPRDLVSLGRMVAFFPGVGAKTLEKIAAAAAEAGVPAFSFLASPDFGRRFASGRAGKASAFAAWCARVAAIDLARADLAVRLALELPGLAEILADDDEDKRAEERLDNLYSLAARANEFVRRRLAGEGTGEGDGEAAGAVDLPAFLEDVALVADIDGAADGASRITLMTLHNAKGLEFDDVFIAGLEEGLLPHRNAVDDSAAAEERRLFYVGLTRARERAWLSHAEIRTVYGGSEIRLPSRFLAELPLSALEKFDYSGSGRTGAGRRGRNAGDGLFDPGADFDPNPGFLPETPPDFPEPAGESLSGRRRPPGRGGPNPPAGGGWKAGDLVRHPLHGSGKVLSGEKRRVMVQFFSSGIRVFPADLAQLRRE
ncbi:MAG: UvrD-helicase domain-containing protein [Planctomycetota bacterium]|jgi:DNA helicase-2/ATP-dependent DNA helicase PcrA|nr:UvrD-helicase domain-containing protein [Planctomycetota bacterium]